MALTNSDGQQNSIQKHKGHSPALKLLLALIFLISIGAAAYGGYLLITNGNISSGILNTIITPKPEPIVISARVYEAAPNDDYTIIVEADIKNDGGSGDVRVSATVNAFGQSLMKNTYIYLNSQEARTVTISFPEFTVEPRILQALIDALSGAYSKMANPDINFDISANAA